MGRLNRARRLGATAILLLTLSPESPPAEAARTITMSGATPAQAVVADLAFFYRREHRDAPHFSLVGGGTGTGIADAARGVVDAGLSGRALTSADPPGLVFTPLAVSAVCLVTNPANPVANLTRAQLQDLVANRVTNWSQIAGSTRTDAIVSVAFDATSAARSVFDNVFLDLTTPIAYQPRTFSVTAQVRGFIARTPAAWGYLDLNFARSLHAVTYEGIPCTRATVLSGAYPARRMLGFVTRGRPSGELARFLRWIRHDATAKRVIATRYVVPS
jgi:phosphate transport system substrate-binding protein